jgi:hypothetical protein
LAKAQALSKPVVVNFLGAGDDVQRDGNVVKVPTLEDAALWAVASAGGRSEAERPRIAPELIELARVRSTTLAPGRTKVRGLYSGGTLCKEALHILGHEHELIDLGDDEYTVGRPHPMIDPRLRNERIAAAIADRETAVVLLDVVLGYGSHDDPAGALVPVLQSARDVVVIASVCGTEKDPQGLARQSANLREAGVVLAPSNAQAARLAKLVAEGRS